MAGHAAAVLGRWRSITPPGVDAEQHPCTALQFDPSNPSTLYALYGGSGLWRSLDAGATWQAIGNLPRPNSLGRLLIDPHNPQHLYATGSVDGNSWGFWVSNDGGQTWAMPQAFEAGASKVWNLDVYNIATNPRNFAHVLLTFHRGWPGLGERSGLLETKDGGKTFIVHPPAAGMDHGQGVAFLFNPATSQGNPRTWLVGAGYGEGLFRTADAGKTWQRVAALQQNHGGFGAHYSTQGFLYIGARDAVYRSTDNGVTWTATGATGGWYYAAIGDGKRLYTANAYVGQAYDAPLRVTPEGGPNEAMAAWTNYSEQTLHQGPWSLVFEPTSRTIYAATWGGGAWALSLEP